MATLVLWDLRRVLAVLTVFYLATFAASAGAVTFSQDVCPAYADPSWTSSEEFAWQQICKNQVADFKGRPDPERTLSMGFLRAILSNPTYTKLIPGGRVSISSAKFGSTLTSDGEILSAGQIVNANMDEIEFDDCLIGDLEFIGAKIRRLAVRRGEVNRLTIKSGNYSDVVLSPGMAKGIALENTTIDSSFFIGRDPYSYVGRDAELTGMFKYNTNANTKTDTNIDYLGIAGAHIRAFWFVGGTISGVLNIYNSTFDAGLSTFGGVGSFGVYIASASILDTKINGALNLSFSNISSSVSIQNTESDQVSLPISVPKSILLKSLKFSSWLNDLPTTIAYVNANTAYDPNLFEKIAQSFRQDADYSAARKIQYLKASKDYQHSVGIQKFLSLISWAAVGYGFYPEVGFIWIGVLVVCGFFVFRTGQLTSGVSPRSWLVYSVDTVVPIIRLDLKHDDIQFSGWRQYFVYMMRMLSAGLAYLVFKFLQNAITAS